MIENQNGPHQPITPEQGFGLLIDALYTGKSHDDILNDLKSSGATVSQLQDEYNRSQEIQ